MAGIPGLGKRERSRVAQLLVEQQHLSAAGGAIAQMKRNSNAINSVVICLLGKAKTILQCRCCIVIIYEGKPREEWWWHCSGEEEWWELAVRRNLCNSHSQRISIPQVLCQLKRFSDYSYFFSMPQIKHWGNGRNLLTPRTNLNQKSHSSSGQTAMLNPNGHSIQTQRLKNCVCCKSDHSVDCDFVLVVPK